MWETLHKEQVQRKKLHNIVEDFKGKIRVFARCRPFAAYEKEKGCKQAVTIADLTTLSVDKAGAAADGKKSGGATGSKQYTFDSVFGPDSTQEEVFEDTEAMIESVLDGFNACIFAYGQTGSGKTWTMTGVPGNEGLTPRSVHQLFARAGELGQVSTVTVRMYFVELYNDQLVDLLRNLEPKGKKKQAPPALEIKVDASKMVIVKNAIVRDVGSAEELLQVFDQANKSRHVGATKMNAESSRSHSILGLYVENYNKQTKKTSKGKLSLIDLAGSERAKKTEATGAALAEGMAINKSLSALGNVISALSTGASFVPYRENKLTLLMQDSLGGNAKTLMFVNISPADYNAEETMGSLTYASRVKNIKNNAEKNQESQEVARLKKIIASYENGGGGEGGGGAAGGGGGGGSGGAEELRSAGASGD